MKNIENSSLLPIYLNLNILLNFCLFYFVKTIQFLAIVRTKWNKSVLKVLYNYELTSKFVDQLLDARYLGSL